PHTDHWYVASVIVPFPGGIINEYDANGVLVRNIVPSNMLKNPLGMDVGTDGTLYYAELNLNPDFSTGCGRVSMVRFVGGVPLAASKARSDGGMSAPTNTTPFATEDAPKAGGPFCSHATVRAVGSKACMVGCWTGVSRGSFGSHGWPPKSPRAVPP